MRIAFLAALVAVASCSSSALDVGSLNPAGTYTLVRVDDRLLPAAITSGFTVRGTVELKSSYRYSLSQSDSVTGPATTASGSGGWTVNENTLQLNPDGGGLLLGIVFNDTLRMAYNGHQNLYVRH